MSKLKVFGGFDDIETEEESPLSDIPNAIARAFEGAPAELLDPTVDLVKDISKETADAAVDLVKEVFGLGEKKFTPKGEIKDFHDPNAKEKTEKSKAEVQLARARVQIVQQEEVIVAQQDKIKKSKEVARIVGAGLSSDQKKDLLHVSIDYAEEHIDNPYHMVNLRQKLKEQEERKKKEDEARQVQSIKIKGKGGIDMNKVAEGGQAQLSSTGGGGIG
jgi:hypothetical protein